MKKKKQVLWLMAILILFYPAYALFQATNYLGPEDFKVAENKLVNFQISAWLTWIVLICISIYYKWSRRKNAFFFFTYAYLLIVFGIFGYLSQDLVMVYNLPNQFEDNHTFGFFIALQNILAAGVLTGFLQGAVWWFTRKWHRR